MRSQEDQKALIELVNETITLSNATFTDLAASRDSDAVRLIQDNLSKIWYGYFSDGRVEDTPDRQLFEALSHTPFNMWPRDFVTQAMAEYMRLTGKPAFSVFNREGLKPESRYLLGYAEDITSQSGEDGILKKIFETIDDGPKWCVEFGAWDGRKHSNTYALITEESWDAILIEANPERFKKLEETFRDHPNAILMNTFVGFDPKENSLDFLLSETDIPHDFDLLVIDIDGNDWHIWDSIQDFRPRVIVIEHNPTIPNNVFFVQERNPQTMIGCSLLSLIALGKTKGYELVCTTNYNGIFVRSEDFDRFGIEDNSIDAMHSPLMDGCIFHGYDSNLHALGMPTIIWDWYKRGRDWSGWLKEKIKVHDANRPI